jgi:hypothetical protein
MSGLDGWTKVGDTIHKTGRWVIYRHKAVSMSALEALEDFPANESRRAAKAYERRAKSVGRGGIWLVSPDGLVCALTFIRV